MIARTVTIDLTPEQLERIINALEVHASNLATRSTRRLDAVTRDHLRAEVDQDLALVNDVLAPKLIDTDR